MTNLKQDLDQYLLLQSDKTKNLKVPQLQTKLVVGLGKVSNTTGIQIPNVFQRFVFSKFFYTNENSEANNWRKETRNSCPKLTRFHRIIGFVASIGIGSLCISISIFCIPTLIFKARKFVLLYMLGTMFCILSLCFLNGFGVFVKQMFSKSRLFSSCFYILCLFLTLYCALVIQSTLLTVLFALTQITTSFFITLGMIPGGPSGLKFLGKIFKSSVTSSSTLPV